MVQVPLAVGIMAASQLVSSAIEAKGLSGAAANDRENARLAELDGALEGEAIRRRERAVSGEAISALAANGVQIGAGSAYDLLFQNALEREHAVLASRYGAASEARAHRAAAAQKKAAARGALFNGVLRAGAAALTGINDMENQAALADAGRRVRAAQLPGASRMPIPAHLLPGARGQMRGPNARWWIGSAPGGY